MDHLTKKQRSLNMSKIRSKDTAPEKKVRKLLTNMGWRYRLHSLKLPGKPDIIISKVKSVLFINGCFWHQHPGCKRKTMPKTNKKYWEQKLERNVKKQKEDIKKLKKTGWSAYIIWECETNNTEKIKKKINKFL